MLTVIAGTISVSFTTIFVNRSIPACFSLIKLSFWEKFILTFASGVTGERTALIYLTFSGGRKLEGFKLVIFMQSLFPEDENSMHREK